MRSRLTRILPNHKSCICTIYNYHLYIVDWKDINNGKVEISGKNQKEINAVHLSNENNIEILFDAFPENALPLTKKRHCKQCECVTFPISCDKEEWILFVETKYANNLKSAQNPDNDYPYCMVRQIKETVTYFRNKGIISKDRIVHAIISFPNLIEPFDSWTFPIKYDGKEESILDIYTKDKIIIRATNNAQILNDKIIILLS